MPPFTGPVIRRGSGKTAPPAKQSVLVGSKLPPAPQTAPSHELLHGVVKQIAANAKQVTQVPTQAQRTHLADLKSRQQLSQALKGVGQIPKLTPVPQRNALQQVGHELGKLPIFHGKGGLFNYATITPDQGSKDFAKIGTTGANVVRSVADPHADLQTIRSIPSVAEAIPAAGIEAVTHPKQFVSQLVKQTKADYKRRYDVSSAEQRKYMHKYGYLSYLLDAIGPVGGGTKVAGEALGAAARSGHLGDELKDFATAERPGLRVTQGERGVIPQERSSNLFRLAAQRGKDTMRQAHVEKRMAEAKAGGAPFRGLVPGEGEVVQRSLMAQGRAQRKIGVADEQARRRLSLNRTLDREVRNGTNREVSSLSRNERLGLKYYIQLGLPADRDTALRELKAHRENIVNNRAARGTEVLRTDELPAIDKIIAHPEQYLTPKVREVADLQVARGKRTGALDPDLTDEQALSRQYADQASHLGIKRQTGETPEDYATRVAHQKALFPADGESAEQFVERMRKIGKDEKIAQRKGESAQDFVARVRQAADERGLVEPGYFMGAARSKGANSPYSAGSLGRAVTGNKRYTGSLFQTGRQLASPDILSLGFARNIKRAENWNGTADVFERNTPAWGRNRSLKDLENEIERRGLDARDWRFYDPKRFRKISEHDAGTEHDSDLGAEQSLHDAIKASTRDLGGARADFAQTRGLSIVPRDIASELESSTKPSGKAMRGLQKLQGLQSAGILNFNPTFVPVQVASQAPLAALAMGSKPLNLLRAQRWYKQLDEGGRDFVDNYIGESASRAFSHQPRFGGSADGVITQFFDRVADNPKLRQNWNSLKNPLKWNPYLDDKQNAFFRRAVFYNEAKRLAAKRMGGDINGIIADAHPVIDALKMQPGAARDEALRLAEPEAEQVGRKVNKLLGDYSSYTANERQTLRTFLMFYGFLRWSVQFTFHTLPIDHPVALGVAAKLGQLHDEEVIDLLSGQAAAQGMGSKEQVAELIREGKLPSVFGRVWLRKGGHVESASVSRVNPLANPVLDAATDPRQAIFGLLSPAVQAAADTVYNRNNFTKKNLTDENGNELSGGQDVDYILGQVARSVFPLRVGENLLHPGSLADNSIPLVHERNAYISGPAAQASEQQRLQERGSNKNVALDSLLPLVRTKQDGTLRGIAKLVENQQKKGKGKGSSIWDGIKFGPRGPSVWDTAKPQTSTGSIWGK